MTEPTLSQMKNKMGLAIAITSGPIEYRIEIETDSSFYFFSHETRHLTTCMSALRNSLEF